MPNVGIAIFPTAFCIEAVGLCDSTRFMIAADKMNTLRISKLQADEKRYCFDTEQTAIHVVAYISSVPISKLALGFKIIHTQKEIICIRAKATYSENLYEIEKLTVDIPNDCDGCCNMDDVALFHKQLFGLCAYCFNHRVGEQLLLV
jgi:hypothetical protein